MKSDYDLMKEALDCFDKMVGRKPEFVENCMSDLRNRLTSAPVLKVAAYYSPDHEKCLTLEEISSNTHSYGSVYLETFTVPLYE